MKDTDSDILVKCVKQQRDYVIINVEVKPGSRNTEIRRFDEWRECIEITVQERAERGSANRELAKFLSTLFSLSQEQVAIVKGEKTKKKSIRISGLTKEEILTVLRNEIEKNKIMECVKCAIKRAR